MSKEFYDKVSNLIASIRVKKENKNNFGGYTYRSVEDIQAELKQQLNGLIVTVSDDIVMVGDRFYVKSTATITDGESSISNTAFARESLDKKGMDSAQITGAASSYARKYALSGLLLLENEKDADATNNHGKAQAQSTQKITYQKPQQQTQQQPQQQQQSKPIQNNSNKPASEKQIATLKKCGIVDPNNDDLSKLTNAEASRLIGNYLEGQKNKKQEIKYSFD
jgi:hypothetical protein